jgi:hypothetical protein
MMQYQYYMMNQAVSCNPWIEIFFREIVTHAKVIFFREIVTRTKVIFFRENVTHAEVISNIFLNWRSQTYKLYHP